MRAVLKGLVGAVAVGALAVALVPSTARGQAGEIRSDLAPPQAYWNRLREHPADFEWTRSWRRAGGGGPAAVEGGDPGDPLRGEFPLLVIPALFADSEEALFDQSALQGVLFDGPAADGTLVEFYEAASRGAFTVRGEVLTWVRTSLTVSQVVADSYGLGDDAMTGEYLVEAIELNDPNIDYGGFDSDGPDGIPNSGDDDGFVDALVFEFQEVSASCGGPGIWPHRWVVQGWFGSGAPPVTTDDESANGGMIRISDYIIQGSTGCEGTDIQNASVISHEFGHALGLPDIYHPIDGIEPQFRRWVLGCWGLMAAGSWGCGDGSTRGDIFGPTGMSPWSKNELGWTEWIDPQGPDEEEIVLQDATATGQALRVPLDAAGQEFLVLEYRSQQGFDDELPSEGVLVYHWDLEGVRRPERDSGVPYLFSMEEADGRTDLRLTHANGGNRGEASDAWGVDGRLGPFDAFSTPNTRCNDGAASTVAVHSMQVEGEEARIRLTVGEAPGLLDAGALPEAGHHNPYSGSLELTGCGAPYTASLVGDAHGLLAETEGRFLRLEGAPDERGALFLTAQVTDAFGNSRLLTFALEVGEFVMDVLRAVTAFIDNGQVPVNEGEASLLDEGGNQNGEYDIGDLRAFLYAEGGS